MTTSDETFGVELTADELAEMEAREASGYWDMIESGRYEVRYRTHPQQQEHHATSAFDTEAAAAAYADELKGRDLFHVVVAPVYIYRGTGEVVGG